MGGEGEKIMSIISDLLSKKVTPMCHWHDYSNEEKCQQNRNYKQRSTFTVPEEYKSKGWTDCRDFLEKEVGVSFRFNNKLYRNYRSIVTNPSARTVINGVYFERHKLDSGWIVRRIN